MLVKRIIVAAHAELITAFCTACAEELQTGQVLCYQRTWPRARWWDSTARKGVDDGREPELHLRLPQLPRSLRRYEGDGDRRPFGSDVPLASCDRRVVFLALTVEEYADPSGLKMDCYFCKPGPCRFGPSTTTDNQEKGELT